MPQVPIFQREVAPQNTPMPYQNQRPTFDMFNNGISENGAALSKAIQGIGDKFIEIKQVADKTKFLEMANDIEKWQQENLFDKDKGYYCQTGKNAVGKSADVMGSYDKFVQSYLGKAGVLPSAYREAQGMIAQKRTRIAQDVTAHDVKETLNWSNNTVQISIQDNLKGMVNNRNNDTTMETYRQNGYKSIEWLGEVNHLDEDTIKLKKAEFDSAGNEAVLTSYISEGSLKAGEYFEQHKDKIKPERHSIYIAQIKNEKDKYLSRDMANTILARYPNDEKKALKEAGKITDVSMSDSVSQRIRQQSSQKRRLEDQQQDDLLDGMYNQAAVSIKNGELPTEDLIPAGLDGKNYLAAKSYINQMAKKGDVDTDNGKYFELYEMRNNDAQNFTKMNLAQYRPYLSNDDYKTFQKMQLDIKSMTPTQLKDDDKIIKDGLEVLGFEFKKGVKSNDINIGRSKGPLDDAFINAANAHIREYQLKHGKTLSREDMSQVVYTFAKDFNYEDPGSKKKMYELYTKGMNEQVGFTRAVFSDFESAKKLKGADLTDEEKYTIVNKRVSKTIQEQNTILLNSISPSRTKQPSIGDVWQGHKITSSFGERQAPINGASTNHKGLDLAYLNNEPFKAFASGTVVNSGFDNGLGNFIDIKSADNTVHRYAHANKILKTKGSVVKAGDLIGHAGSTGISSGPHLHYEKLKNGRSINPLEASVSASNTKSKQQQMAYVEGTIISNKAGKKMIMKGGKWQAM